MIGTKSLTFSREAFEGRLHHCRIHINNFLAAQPVPPETFTALELGTGWFPTIAIGLYLCGAGKTWIIDIDPLLRSSRIQQVVQFFCEYDDRNELQKFLPRVRRDRLDHLRKSLPFVQKESPEQFLQRLDIHPMVRDAQVTGLPEQSVDLIFSTGVLEYIPRPVLQGILAEFKRISSKRSIMSHWIIVVDQFAWFDRSITPFNYLKYSNRQWRYLDSPLISQSRLRICDFREMFKKAGFEILSEENESGHPSDLDKIRLASEFQGYSRDDLLVLKSWMVTRPLV